MSTKKLQILGSLGEKIYKQNEEPVDAPDGTLWIDMNAGGSGMAAGGIQSNFCVVGGMTEPESPTENMIWIKTSVEITDIVFNAIEPVTPVEGMVWIMTGTTGYVSFNSLKINNVYLNPYYPLDAQQYVSGTWIDVAPAIYQGEKWARVINGIYLYRFGDESSDVNNGFNIVKSINSGYVNSNTKKEEAQLKLQANSGTDTCFVTKQKINVSGYKKLCANIVSTTGNVFLGINTTNTCPLETPESKVSISTAGVVELTFTTTDEYYICIGSLKSSVVAYIDEIWLEK